MSTPRDPFLLPGDEAPVGDKLQKFLSAAGVASRRHSEVLIKQGRVTVNGKVALLGIRVVEGDVIRVGGVEVGPQAPRLLMLNKPAGIVTTLDDPQGRPTVADLVPDDVRIYPVGRLDIDTSGLLLMTNDGELAHRLMHPSFEVVKTYRALVEGGVSAANLRLLAEGLELEDGMTAPAQVRVIDAGAKQSVIELSIHEGRNRQVRRMFGVIGHHVLDLVRVAYGPLVLAGVAPGETRPLEDREIRRLRKVAGLAPPRRSDRVKTRAERRASLQRELSPEEQAKADASQKKVIDGDGEADAKRGRGADDQRKAPKRAAGGAGRSSSAGTSSGASKGRNAKPAAGRGKGRPGGSSGGRGPGSRPS
ncbi:MAG: pseudouridine synthase [Gaiellales bacterium]